jgi:hypothetical protein
MEKEAEKQEQAIKSMIVDGYRRGVCDKEGHSVRGRDGRLTAKPRYLGPKSLRKKYHAN